MSLRASEIATELNVSRARVSQWTSDGTLDGAFTGQGRNRRYDLDKVKRALNQQLDPGQSLGHGAYRAAATQTTQPKQPSEASHDNSRYQDAKTLLVEEQVRARQRDNALADGTFALVAEVTRQMQNQMAAEVAGFDAMLTDAARAVADELHVNAAEVLKILRDTWRTHRGGRQSAKLTEADAAQMTEAEQEADI